MKQRTGHLRRGIGLALGALVVAGAPAVTLPGAQAATSDPSGLAFFTPVADGTVPLTPGTGTGVHVVLGAASSVASVRLEYSTDDGRSWQTIAGSLTRRPRSTVFDTTWRPPAVGEVDLRATGYAAGSTTTPPSVVGTPLVESVTVSSKPATAFSFIRPAPSGSALGVFRRADGHAFARTSGRTTGSTEPTAVDPVAAPTASRYPSPTGALDRATGIFREPVDLTGHVGLTLPGRAVIRLQDDPWSDAVEAPVYAQTVAAVRSTTTPVAGTRNVTVTARVTDQYGQPVVGAVVRLTGYASGSTPVSQLAVSDAFDGLARFAAPVPGTGYYTAYADLNLDGRKGSREPAFATVLGTVAKAAPGKSFFHSDTRIPNAGGVLSDSLRGTKIAAARGYDWIDQDGQLAYASPAQKRAGAARVAQPGHLVWVNAHGAPYNPRWLGKGRFETRAWSKVRHRPGLRNAAMTFQQNAARGISVEWEVKNIRPFTTRAALDAAFSNLAAAAQDAYGAAWRSRVQVKMLSDLTGGQAFALKVLRVAHAHGFTTLMLARGAATRTPIPAAAHQFVTYVRGARAGLYASTAPSPGPVRVTEPPRL